MNEFALIQRYFQQGFPQQANTHLAIGDDCSVVRQNHSLDLVQSIDTQVAGIHFPAQAPADLIAERALRCAASDLAAMGATPYGFHLAITLPEANEAWLERFSEGLKAAANELEMQLLGGDTTRGNQLVISIAVQGTVPKNQALTRSGAQVGDEVWVSDTIGRAALALPQVLDNPADISGLARSYYFPQVHFLLGQALLNQATACMDISDGLLQDAIHLARASNVSLQFNADAIPTLAEPLSPNWMQSITGGDDYQLLFTAPKQLHYELMNLTDKFSGLCCIGEVIAATDKPLILQHQGKEIELSGPLGFQHF